MDTTAVLYSWFSHDVTAAITVSPNNETAAILVSQSNRPGIELLLYKRFLLFSLNNMAVDQVSETQEILNKVVVQW